MKVCVKGEKKFGLKEEAGSVVNALLTTGINCFEFKSESL